MARASKALQQRCILCSAAVAETSVAGVFAHPQSTQCRATAVDADGLSIDDKFVIEDGVVYTLTNEDLDPPPSPIIALVPGDDIVSLDGKIYTTVDAALTAVFAKAGRPVLGGSSGVRGWSSISTFQRCPHLWRQTFGSKDDGAPSHVALQTGSLLHAVLAVYYARMLDPGYPIEPMQLINAVDVLNVDPDIVADVYRLTIAYFQFYTADQMTILAVEHRVADPKTGDSCRFDLIVRLNEPMPGLLSGTYTMDHKTTAAFSEANLAWHNDGSVLQQLDLYDRLKLEKRFGPLQGHVINMIGKQIKPKFQRIFVPPVPGVVKDHRKSLRIWGATIALAREMNHFPKSRANCVNKHVKCDLYDECAGHTGTETA